MLLAGTALVFAGSAQAQESYKIGGGPAGGGWHPAVSAGAQLLNSELDGKYKFNYSPSNGSVDNVRRVSLGKFDTAWGHIGQVFQAWNGVGLFEEDGANKDFRVIANVRKQSQIVAVLADSPIKTFSDMKGKIVNLLNKGSGSNVNCRNIMIGAGIIDSVEVRNLGFSDSARALGDRQIDVFCSAGAPFLIPALTSPFRKTSRVWMHRPIRLLMTCSGWLIRTCRTKLSTTC
jgi:TRAP transporter TAXI family solute receptor